MLGSNAVCKPSGFLSQTIQDGESIDVPYGKSLNFATHPAAVNCEKILISIILIMRNPHPLSSPPATEYNVAHRTGLVSVSLNPDATSTSYVCVCVCTARFRASSQLTSFAIPRWACAVHVVNTAADDANFHWTSITRMGQRQQLNGQFYVDDLEWKLLFLRTSHRRDVFYTHGWSRWRCGATDRCTV